MKNNTYIILSISIIIAALILGGFFYQAVNKENTIKVVGVAKRPFEADTLKWSVDLETEVGPQKLQQGYLIMKDRLLNFKEEISKIGIETQQFNVQPIQVTKEFDYIYKDGNSERVFRGYRLNQYIFLITKNIDQVENLVLNPLELYSKNIFIKNSNLQYYFSEIDNLKKEIIAEATVNARERAERMLEETDLKPDKVLSMNSGIFQITEPYSTDTSSMGIYNTSSRNKEISVTAHAVFSIK
ncbi:MAG: SIMPL domain-containing protein [Bacillota bacterium]